MPWLPKQTVVVPVDFSDDSERAVLTARELVAGPAALHLINVLFPLDSMTPGFEWGDVTDAKREEAVRQNFQALVAKLGLEGVNVAVRFGNPGLEIADYAADVAADLIVIPSHGYHGLKRLVLGSVAERVIRHAGCSVLVLRRSDAE